MVDEEIVVDYEDQNPDAAEEKKHPLPGAKAVVKQ
jgi:hypothetical protein